jgi:flagellar motor switch protein FliN/FliY
VSVSTLVEEDLKLQQFESVWAASISRLLEQVSGSRTHVTPLEVEEARARINSLDDPAWFRFRLPSGQQPGARARSGEAEIVVAISGNDVQTLGELLIGPALTPAATESDPRTAVSELFRQAASSALGAAAGIRELQMELAGRDAPQSTEDLLGVQVESEGSIEFGLFLVLGSDLMNALPVSSAPHPTRFEAPAARDTAPSAVAPDSKIGLLLDVELEVTLRFGERHMLLREILELAPSSVVELDQAVNDPVELLVGRKVVARGEVVVVDGNYGLRVTEIVSGAERMNSVVG